MVKKRKAISKETSKPFIEEYNFELTVILLFGLGIFLLVEDLEIKHYIAIFIRNIFFIFVNIIEFIRDHVIFIIKRLEVSDIVGIFFILLGLYLIVNRWRERMIVRHTLLLSCPDCDKKLHRIHKNLNQKILSIIFFLKVKHYRCNTCSYKGFKLEKHN